MSQRTRLLRFGKNLFKYTTSAMLLCTCALHALSSVDAVNPSTVNAAPATETDHTDPDSNVYSTAAVDSATTETAPVHSDAQPVSTDGANTRNISTGDGLTTLALITCILALFLALDYWFNKRGELNTIDSVRHRTGK